MFFERIKSNLSSAVSAHGRVRVSHSLPHALIVNDSLDEISVLGAVLRRRGFTTSAACDAQQVLSRSGSEVPDVIIIDENAVYPPQVATEIVDFAASIGCELVVLGKLTGLKGRSKTWIEIATPYHYDALVRRIERTPRVRNAA